MSQKLITYNYIYENEHVLNDDCFQINNILK